MLPSSDDFPSYQDCIYTPFYCEENIWKLCEKLDKVNYSSLDDCYVVFASNASRQVTFMNQSRGTGPNRTVTWDYHVFLVRKNKKVVDVYDFDTTLGFPVPLVTYLRRVIGSEIEMPPLYHRLFRVIRARRYLKTFASDRSHMKGDDGKWLQPPPQYDPIKNETSSHNIEEFISMRSKEVPGDVMSLEGFIRFFTDGKSGETRTKVPEPGQIFQFL